MTVAPPPPRLEDLPAGTRLVAGLGHATVLPDIDFETYSEAGYVWNEEKNRWDGPPGAAKGQKGLPVVGAAVYSKHPTAEVIWCAYDLKDGKGKRQWFPGMPAPMDLIVHVVSGGLLEAWNVGFERWIWENVCGPKYGWPAVQDWQWRCAMAKARASGYPGKLEKTGEVMNLNIQKDKAGAGLMKVFSMPRQPTAGDPRRRVRPLYTTEQAQAELQRRLAHQWSQGVDGKQDRSLVSGMTRALAAVQEELTDTYRYGAYNVTDIASEAEASSRIPDLEGEELLWWQTHEKINRRGVHIDRVGVENCIAIVEQALRRYNGELFELTGIDAASKVEQLQGWLRGQGVFLDSLDEDTVSEALKGPTLQGTARRVLEIRAAVGSASVKKLFAIRNALDDDDRLRDLYIYYGARTGRSTGDGPQPTNLPKAGPDTVQCGAWHEKSFVEGSGCRGYFGKHHLACPHCKTPKYPKPRVVEWNPEVAEFALQVIASRSLEWVEYIFGEALLTIAGCIRALFDAAPGHDLISTDYNSIEAVGLAMVTGEKWRIEVFRGHGKIYETSAAMTFRVPFEEFEKHKAATGQHHPLRQKGKIGELAFGYQGWLGAAQAFGMPGTDEEIKADILAWRRASPAVEWFWGGQTLGKALGAYSNATLPEYTGDVDERLAPIMAHAEDRWDRRPFLFGVEGMAVQAMLTPNEWHHVTRLDGTYSGVSFQHRNGVLYCRIPSGRVLTYHAPALTQSERGEWALSYEGWNSNPKNGPMGWIRMNTWGGRLTENIIQAVCRDILRAACIALEEFGYSVVLHVYDEIVAEVLQGWGSVEEFERIVTTIVQERAAWSRPWPIRAPGGYRARRYRKG
jgi:DNA polymerase bacteriophage-type